MVQGRGGLARSPDHERRSQSRGRTTAPGLAGTTWRAETIMGRPVIDSAASTITFEADGRVSGRGGCNRYFGTRVVSLDVV
jgi:heat shock protein HslJ